MWGVKGKIESKKIDVWLVRILNFILGVIRIFGRFWKWMRYEFILMIFLINKEEFVCEKGSVREYGLNWGVKMEENYFNGLR